MAEAEVGPVNRGWPSRSSSPLHSCGRGAPRVARCQACGRRARRRRGTDRAFARRRLTALPSSGLPASWPACAG
eukprot:6069398-Lingulodinium_polyedra.AAC.1